MPRFEHVDNPKKPRFPVANQMTFNVQYRKGITTGRTFRNGLNETPYLPSDPERRRRLLEAIETINRDRAAAT